MGLGRRWAGLLAVAALVAGPRAAVAQELGTRESEVVRQLDFRGNDALPDPTLAASIVTTQSSWFARSGFVSWLKLGEKRYFDERAFQGDVLRLQILYKRSGFPDVAVDTLVRRQDNGVYLTFVIDEGTPIRVDSLTVDGLDSLPRTIRERVLVDLPLREGDVFNRYVMQASADSIAARLQNRGYPAAEVFTSFESNEATRLAGVSFDVVPGTRSVIGEVRVEGDERVDSTFIVSLLTSRPRRRYSEDDVLQSQRTLYDSELFRFATVGIDSAAWDPGSGRVPLVVQVSEARPQRARASLGFGTNDCFRTGLGYTYRGFLGDGRIIDVTSRFSKIGVGEPLDFGLRDSFLCTQLSDDSLGSGQVNYNVTTSLRRPAFLSPNNAVTLSLFAERRSEFRIYLREEVGGSVVLTRRTPRRRLPLSLAYTLSFGRTLANQASFCAFLGACGADDIAALRERRRLAVLSAAAALPRSNNPIDPTRGYDVSVEVAHASPFVGSSSFLQFTRFVGSAAWYRQLSRDVVLSWRVGGGILFSPAGDFTTDEFTYVPAEHRFYGGGPSSVRGFENNQLGPVVYTVSQAEVDRAARDTAPATQGVLRPDSVAVVPTGGNTSAIGSVELRFPAPGLSERFRLAAFLDAGGVWERGREDISPRLIRITPGMGIRAATPLGPARLDIGYNPYSLPRGILYRVNADDGSLVVQDPSYVRPREGGFLRRLTFHFAIGQPF